MKNMLMHFDAQPIPEVVEFIKKHYQGGTIIDIGCGCGRYTECFPKDKYLGVDGYEDNIKAAKENHKGYKFEVRDIESWKPEKFDYLLSSVVLDQLEKLPMGWADTYILIEGPKYAEIYKPKINEPLSCTDGVRKMIV